MSDLEYVIQIALDRLVKSKAQMMSTYNDNNELNSEIDKMSVAISIVKETLEEVKTASFSIDI